MPVGKPTSLAAYEQIKASGLLSESRFKVYDALTQHGPMTGTELDNALENPSAHKRLSELEERGVVKAMRVRRCTVTGLEAAEWHVVEDALPVEPEGIVGPIPKLSVKDMAEALQALRVIAKERQKAKKQLDPALIRLGKWLAQRIG